MHFFSSTGSLGLNGAMCGFPDAAVKKSICMAGAIVPMVERLAWVQPE
jgi:hypothetical protein